MDIVDYCSYKYKSETENLPEATRQAFVDIFDADRESACLVINHLLGITRWADQTETNDPIINAKMNTAHGIIREIKRQLNMPRIELQGEEEWQTK